MKKTYIEPNAQLIKMLHNDIITSSSQAVVGEENFYFYNEGVDAGL